MTPSPAPKPFGPTNELAKERNRAAAERTINSWIGHCLTLIGIGLAVDQIFRSLKIRFPDRDTFMTEKVAEWTSLAFVGFGLFLLAIALMQHRLIVNSIRREDYIFLSVNALNRVVVTGVVLMGLLGLFIILFLL